MEKITELIKRAIDIYLFIKRKKERRKLKKIDNLKFDIAQKIKDGDIDGARKLKHKLDNLS